MISFECLCISRTNNTNSRHKLTDCHVNSQECVAKLNVRQLVSVSMDGPDVNLKLGDLLQKEHAELYGAQLVKVGSCGELLESKSHNLRHMS